MAEHGDLLLSVLSGIRVPRGGDRVHKDECAFSFDSPESEWGLYVCMNSFFGFGKQFVERHYQKTGQRVYLHLKRTRKPKVDDGSSGAGDPPKKKPTRLAIGVEGGFEAPQESRVEGGFDVPQESCEFDEEVKIVILPEHIAIPRESLAQMPGAVRDRVTAAVDGILAADSASRKQEVQSWDGEVRQVSKHALELKQLDNSVRIPPCGWQCARCEMKENLWLNLTDGSILCGRRYFDGSGGNNHALEHYRQLGFPLAVKLGTITPDGADVYSYDEDEMVLDPNLAEHLTHFRIDMMKMQKTDKTMTELEIDMNQRIGEWETIQESGGTLRPLYGPEYTGIRNLGNSCYLNSVMQVVFSIPDFQSKYVGNREKIFKDSPADPTQDFNTQLAKLGFGLLSGENSKAPIESDEADTTVEPKTQEGGIAPRMFKALVGKGHPEFSTNRQQDAQEYFLHFINMVERNCRSSDNPNEAFRFLVEEKINCLASGKVKYTHRVDYIIQLPVPMEAAVNKEELMEYEARKQEAEGSRGSPPEMVRARVPFEACLRAYSEPEHLDDFWSTALLAKSMAVKTTRFASFPDYLVIQIKKFTFGLDWVPKKLDVCIEMPDELDFAHLRGRGLQVGEEELPDVAPPLLSPEAKAPALDEMVIVQLCEMGFPAEACRKAVYYTGNSGVEAAMGWVMSHLEDPDFAHPLVLPGSSGPGSVVSSADPPPEDSIATIVSMGFSREQAVRALRSTSNSLERAVDWIFSRIDDLEAEAAMDVSEGRSAADSVPESLPTGPRVRDGSGKYRLFAFISHMGTSTMCGHYVCHIKKEGRWVIYNDQKVCASEKPPKDLGYIYYYQRLVT